MRDENFAARDELLHVAEEEGEQQRADVRAVNVGVRHDDDLAVAQLGQFEVFAFADAGADGGDHSPDFFVAQHLVVTGLFDIEDLTFEGQDGLVTAIAAGFGGTAGRFTFDQKELAAVWIAFLAIGEFARQTAGIERAFSAGEIACFAGRFTGAGCVNGLADDLLGNRGVLIEDTRPAFR